MTDSWNDETVPRQPAPPQYPTLHPGARVPPTDAPPTFATAPEGNLRGPVDETAWVRSVYLFGACGTAGVLMIVGLLLALSSAVVAVSPDSGLRDGWDRGLVGVTQVVDEGLEVLEELDRAQLEEDFDRICDGDTDDAFCEDLADRIDENMSAIPDEVTDGIGIIRDEIHRQIRLTAMAKLVAGLVLIGVGLLLFRFHAKQVTVYRKMSGGSRNA